MAVDLKALRKLESVPASQGAQVRSDDEPLAVLIKLRKGAKRPDCVRERKRISDQILTGEIYAGDLKALEADPGIVSISLSQKLPNVD